MTTDNTGRTLREAVIRVAVGTPTCRDCHDDPCERLLTVLDALIAYTRAYGAIKALNEHSMDVECGYAAPCDVASRRAIYEADLARIRREGSSAQ